MPLLERTLTSVATLEELLARASQGADEHQQIYNLYGACQFGLQEVVRRWPDHPVAGDTWSRVIEGMVRYELGRGGASSARLLLSQWADPPVALIERLQQAELEADRSRRSDARVLKNASTTKGRARRLGMFAVVGAVWLGLPILMSVMGVERGYPRMFLRSSLVLVAFFGGLGVFYRPWMYTRLNRDVAALIGLAPILGLVLTAVMWGLDTPVPTATVLRALLDAFLIIIGAAVIDIRLWPAAVSFLGATLMAAWAPALTTPLLIAGTVVLVANTSYIWWAPKA
jgi:eukaryotic-like serine/threonine-protein kinase